ncbi:MAG: hypothetical protein QHJ34_02230 [bacterium]|nr:hypothetical protein [candidate division KSB1 bacterium]MDH7559036.1 hypothetical protein [bacterium]
MSSDTGYTWDRVLEYPWVGSGASGFDLGDVVVSSHVKNPIYYGVWGRLFKSSDGGVPGG